jgi:hypothetical protein
MEAIGGVLDTCSVAVAVVRYLQRLQGARELKRLAGASRV